MFCKVEQPFGSGHDSVVQQQPLWKRLDRHKTFPGEFFLLLPLSPVKAPTLSPGWPAVLLEGSRDNTATSLWTAAREGHVNDSSAHLPSMVGTPSRRSSNF